MIKNNIKIEPFLKLNSLLSEAASSDIEAYVYAVIAMHINRETRQAFPSIKRLCKLTRYDKETIIGAIKNLTALGYVKKIQVGSGRGRIKNMYEIKDLKKGFVMISYRFMNDNSIPRELKAFLIKIHPLLDTRVEGLRAKLCISINELCSRFGYNPRIIKERIKKLIDLGIIEFESAIKSRKKFAYGDKKNVFIFNLSIISQDILKLKEKDFKYMYNVLEDSEENKLLRQEEEKRYERRKRLNKAEEKRFDEILYGSNQHD